MTMTSKRPKGRWLLLLFLLLCTVWRGAELQAQAYMEPIQFSTSPTENVHWYRLVMNYSFLTIYHHTDGIDYVVPGSNKFSTDNENDIWCIVRVGGTDENPEVQLYNKGKGQWVGYYLWGGYNYLIMTDQSKAKTFTVADANYVNFEFFLMAEGNKRIDVKTVNNIEYAVQNNGAYEPVLGSNKGKAFMQQSIPLTEQEKVDVIPYLNSEGKANGLTSSQVNALKTAVDDLNKNQSTISNGDITNNTKYFEQIRTELNNLKNTTPLDVNPFPETGYYRIKNASRPFYILSQLKSKNPVMYDAGNNVEWKLSDNSDNEIWHVVRKADGTYSFQNYATGKYFNSADDPEMSDELVSGNLIAMKQQYFPGHYAIHFNDTYAHAINHNNGEGNNGDIGSYKYFNEDPNFYGESSTSDMYDQPSVWLFEPVIVKEMPLTEQEKIDVRRLIWGSGKAGGIKTEDITQLITLWNNGDVSGQEAISALRAERDRLLKFTAEQRVPFDEGYYRIKNGHDGFNINNVTARLYENMEDHTPKWTISETGNEAIYYLKKKDNGKFEMINILSGQYYDGAGVSSVKTEQKTIEISPVNIDKYAGYFKIIYPNGDSYPIGNSAHALEHKHGDGTGDGTSHYSWPDGTPYLQYNFTLPDNNEYPGASTWMFERYNISPISDDDQAKVNAVLNAKEVVDGFTAEQLAEFERLEDLHESIGNSGIAPALVAEVTRLLNLDYAQRIQFEPGYYVIKNGHYDFYERKTQKVLLMNAGEDNVVHVDRVAWKKKEAATAGMDADEVWYVERNESTNQYTFTNLKTLTKIQGFTHTGIRPNAKAAMLAAADAKVELISRNRDLYPAQFMMKTISEIADLNLLIANPEKPGDSSDEKQTGDVLAWLANDPNDHKDWDNLSFWMLRKVNENITGLNQRQTDIKNNFVNSQNRYGGYTESQLSSLKEITDNPYRLLEKIAELRKDERIDVTNGFVRIYSAAQAYTQTGKEKNIYLRYNIDNNAAVGTVANGGPAWKSHNSTSVDEIWSLANVSGDDYTLQSTNNKKYIVDAGGALVDNVVNGKILPLDPALFPGMYELVFDNQNLSFGGHNLGAGTEGNMLNSRQVTDETQSYYWAKSFDESDNINQYSTFYLEAANTIDIKPKEEARWVTFCYPFAVKMPEPFAEANAVDGVWACIENDVDFSNPVLDDFVMVKPLSGQYIAKEIPMLIEMQPAKPMTLNIVSDTEATENNAINQKSKIWKGSLAPVKVELGDFVMRNIAEGKGWYPINDPNSLTLAANKAFIPQNAAPAGIKFFGIVFGENSATSVDGVNTDAADSMKSVIYYDLSGRRVVNPSKGVYITSEGKKVVFK